MGRMTPTDSTGSLAYATADDAMKPATGWIAVWLAVVALCLIILGGCFLVGVGLTTGVLFNLPATVGPIGDFRMAFIALLTMCALACFAGAVWMFVLTARRLPHA